MKHTMVNPRKGDEIRFTILSGSVLTRDRTRGRRESGMNISSTPCYGLELRSSRRANKCKTVNKVLKERGNRETEVLSQKWSRR